MPIQIRGVSHHYMQGSALQHAALSNIDLTVCDGEFLGLIGHTGSGKTTLVQHMGGILQPTAGAILVDGLNMADKKQRVLGRRKVGMVFQYPEYQLFEETVARDIAYGPHNMGLSDAEIEARVQEAMQLVGLPYARFAEKSPFELSGGEKRRAALAGIIAMRPKYLVLDEPMAGLDPVGRQAILTTIDSLRQEIGCAVVMVSHSMEDIARCCDRIAVLNGGELLRVGTPAEVFGQEDELLSIGLDLPEMCRLARALRARGVEVPSIYDVNEMAQFLLSGGGGHV
ncbi:MAG: energy-coupling factor transporter ATPase [Christensenellaceae bacterium]|nr:energy-coupling factor transporter ATPase [Christensenellaceae bacterium]